MNPAFGRGRAALIAMLAFVLTVPGLLASHIASTTAQYTRTVAVGGNTFTTASCWGTTRNQVLTGTATSTGNGTVTVTIAGVDPAKAFLMFQTRHDSNRPVGSSIRGSIASATTLQFTRVTDETSTITIRWYVVEYRCGVRVQRGEVTGVDSPIDIAIAPVASRAQAFVLWSKTALAADSSWDGNDTLVADLSSTSNLQLRADGVLSSHTISWQVVEFTNAAHISVQRGSASMTGTATSRTVTLPTAVTTSRSFALVDMRTTGTGADIGSRMLRARLTDSTTMTIDRSISGSPDDLGEIGWQVVELKDGSAVQRGSAAFASGAATVTAALTPVVAARATAFASVASPGGQNQGRSPYAGDDIVGVGSATLAVSSTQVTLQRGNTAAAADIGWFVVEWGSP